MNGGSIPINHGELTGSMNNLYPGQHSPRLESINGELPLLRRPSHCPEEVLPNYPRQYVNDLYVTKYPSRSCSQDTSKRKLKITNSNFDPERTHELQKYPYRCEENIENLQKYPQRCREEYHRCSENNLIYDRKYDFDFREYPRGYSEDPLRLDERKTSTDLQKFPQRYSEDPLRVSHSQLALKYNNFRCADYSNPNGNFKYSGSKRILPSRILAAGGIPIIGQAAIGLVVNKFGSRSDLSCTDNSFCPEESTEEDLLRPWRIGSISRNNRDESLQNFKDNRVFTVFS